MGLRYRRSVQIIPGLRLNFSKSGIGYSVGVRGARISHSPTGRVTQSVGIPGTGMYYVTTHSSGKSKRAAQQRGAERREALQQRAALIQQAAHAGPWNPPSASVFASAGEKALIKAWRSQDTATLVQVANADGPLQVLACAMGLLKLASTDASPLLPAFATLFSGAIDIDADKMLRKYTPGLHFTIGICDGASASLPPGRMSLGLAYAEMLQSAERFDDALNVLARLSDSPEVTLSKVDLLCASQRWDRVLALTEDAEPDDPIGILLVVHRARAFRAQKLPDAALETLKALNLRTLEPEIKVEVLLERAQAHDSAGQHAAARKDAEMVLAIHSDNPVARALAQSLS